MCGARACSGRRRLSRSQCLALSQRQTQPTPPTPAVPNESLCPSGKVRAMAEWDSHQQARRSFGVLPSAAWPAAAHPPAHASQRPPADADRLETQGNAASTNDTHTTSAIGGRIAAAPAAASGGGGVPPAFPSSFHSSSLPSLPVLHPRSHPPAPSFFQASYRSGEPLSPQVAPSRTMPSFGLTARSALLRDEEHGGAGGESPAATAGATAINRRVGGGGGTGGSLSLRLHRRLLQCVGWLKSLTPLRWATVIGCLLLAVLVVRLLFGVYADRGKFDHFTIVSLMRDMSPDALAADKVSFAFQFTALASWARLVAAGNIIVFVEQADQCAHIQGLVRGVRCLAVPCVHATLHKPQLDCLFDAAHQLARTDIIAYVNSDVALYQDLGQAIATVAKQKDKFMMVGRRTNTLVSGGRRQTRTRLNALWRRPPLAADVSPVLSLSFARQCCSRTIARLPSPIAFACTLSGAACCTRRSALTCSSIASACWSS